MALVAVVLFIAIGVFLYRRPRHVNPPLVQRITVSWPCTFTAQQQNTLIHLSDSQQRDTYLSEMMSLTQQGLSFNLDRGDQVEVMEKSGKTVLVRPISGTHNNATPCYVDQDVVDAPGPAKR